jgi:hypothetical protein
MGRREVDSLVAEDVNRDGPGFLGHHSRSTVNAAGASPRQFRSTMPA